MERKPRRGLVVVVAFAARAAGADLICSEDDVRIASAADFHELMATQAPQAIQEWSSQRASLLNGALENFKESMQAAPDPVDASMNAVLGDAFKGWLADTVKGASGAVAPTLAADLFPGPAGAGAKFLFGFHAKLDERIEQARRASARLALVDWIVSLNTLITETYATPPTVQEVDAELSRVLKKEHGELEEPPSESQVAWAALLCEAIVQVRKDAKPSVSVEQAELALYEAWIRRSKDELKQASCIELAYDAEANGSELALTQAKGSVRLPVFGPQLVRRLDQLIHKGVVARVADIGVPLCVCVDGLPGTLSGRSCRIYNADHRLDHNVGDAQALARIPNDSYWREETRLIDPTD